MYNACIMLTALIVILQGPAFGTTEEFSFGLSLEPCGTINGKHYLVGEEGKDIKIHGKIIGASLIGEITAGIYYNGVKVNALHAENDTVLVYQQHLIEKHHNSMVNFTVSKNDITKSKALRIYVKMCVKRPPKIDIIQLPEPGQLQNVIINCIFDQARPVYNMNLNVNGKLQGILQTFFEDNEKKHIVSTFIMAPQSGWDNPKFQCCYTNDYCKEICSDAFVLNRTYPRPAIGAKLVSSKVSDNVLIAKLSCSVSDAIPPCLFTWKHSGTAVITSETENDGFNVKSVLKMRVPLHRDEGDSFASCNAVCGENVLQSKVQLKTSLVKQAEEGNSNFKRCALDKVVICVVTIVILLCNCLTSIVFLRCFKYTDKDFVNRNGNHDNSEQERLRDEMLSNQNIV